jgi:hypothetical protein
LVDFVCTGPVPRFPSVVRVAPSVPSVGQITCSTPLIRIVTACVAGDCGVFPKKRTRKS